MVNQCFVWIKGQIAAKLLLLMTTLLGVLLLSACQKPPTSAGESGAASANEAALTELVIALDWVPNTNHTGLYVALDKGFFTQQGLKATIVQPSEDSASVLVASKRADLGVYFQPNMVKRLQKGEPIMAVAAIAQKNSAGLMALESLGAKSPADLHGKRYSTWEDVVDDAVVASLVGKPLHKIPGETTDAATALRLDQFDYILAYYGWDAIAAQLRGVATSFFFLADSNPVFDYYTPLLIANSEQLQADPQRHKKALAAISDGYIYAAKHPEESADILLKYAPETNKDLVHASQNYLSTLYLDEQGRWGYFDYQRWDRFFAWVNDQGLSNAPLPMQAGVSNDYLPTAANQ